MGLRKDIWRPAIVEAPIEAIAARGSIEGFPRVWLPELGPFRFLADPFGFWSGGVLHLFAERYDYRDRIGKIDLLRYDSALRLLDWKTVLAEPWHLSYPYVFEADGEVWMLPEAHRSHGLTLYRAAPFPDRWERAGAIALDPVPIDATPFRHQGRWWLLYSSADRPEHKMGALNAAYAERLTGPWTPHPGNPVRLGRDGSRPGGTPFVQGGILKLPVQDCRFTYGGAMRLLEIATLTPDRFEARLGAGLAAPGNAAPYTEGLHTLAAAGPVTLVDMKRTELSPRGLAIEVRRELGRTFRRFGAATTD